MNTFTHLIFQKWILISIGCWLLLLTLSHCVRLRMTDQAIESYFKDCAVKPTFQSYQVNGRKIHYATIGADTLPMVVFVHGSPGDWSAFISFFKDSVLLRKAHLVAVDRPGFGKSGLGKPERSLKRQAAALAPVLDRSRSATLPVLVGHSLGGPVIVRLAIDYPEKVGGLILVAPSIDPDLEPQEWYRHMGNFFLIRPLLPAEIDVSNQEILPLKEELQQMVPEWYRIRVPVTVIQGEEDDLVPAGNASFAKRQLVNAPVKLVMIPHMNHFIPWRRPDLIQQAVLEYLNQ